MTNDEIAKLRALCDAGTPAPLDFDEEGRGGYNAHASWIGVHQQNDEIEPGVFSMMNKPEIAMFARVEDARLFAAARTTLPAALDEISRLRAELVPLHRGYRDLHEQMPGDKDVWSKVADLIAERDKLRSLLSRACDEARGGYERGWDGIDKRDAHERIDRIRKEAGL